MAFLQNIQSGCVSHSKFYSMVPTALIPQVKRQGAETNQSRISSTEIKYEESYTSVPPCVSMDMQEQIYVYTKDGKSCQSSSYAFACYVVSEH